MLEFLEPPEQVRGVGRRALECLGDLARGQPERITEAPEPVARLDVNAELGLGMPSASRHVGALSYGPAVVQKLQGPLGSAGGLTPDDEELT